MNLKDGTYDTTGGPCSLDAAFHSNSFSDVGNTVFHAKLDLLPPVGRPDVEKHPIGETRILFHDNEGRPALLIEALFENGNFWNIVNPQTDESSPLSSLKASEGGHMEFTYDFETGKSSLVAGEDPSPEQVTLDFPPGLRLERVSIENREGGDMRIDSIRLSAIRFSENKFSPR